MSQSDECCRHLLLPQQADYVNSSIDDDNIEDDQSIPLSQTNDIHPVIESDGDVRDSGDCAVITPLLRPLQLLFGLNGLTLSLQSLPLMYIVNTRVALPLAYIPTYGALAFLPWSLKPVYAYLSSRNQQVPRHVLLMCLLGASGIASIATSQLIKPGGIFGCFILAFMRGITDSWAEFCLGLSLIDQAWQLHHRTQQSPILVEDDESLRDDRTHRYEHFSAQFQSQAATARNLGSLLGCVITTLVLIQSNFGSKFETILSDSVANSLLVSTGFLLFIGSFVVWMSRETFRELSMTDRPIISTTTQSAGSYRASQVDNSGITDEESALNAQHNPTYYSRSCCDKCCATLVDDSETVDDQGDPSRTHPFRWNILLVSMLQLTIVALSLKDAIVSWTSHFAWKVLVISLFSALLLTGASSSLPIWTESSFTYSQVYRSGLFLVLRHAIPSSTMVLGSFVYSILYSRPLFLQLLSLTELGITTLSSWSYGALLSKYSRGRQLQMVAAGTTVFAGFMSLGNVLFVRHVQQEEASGNNYFGEDTSSVSLVTVGIALVTTMVATFANEWEFLPDVIIATTSISLEEQHSNYTHGQPARQQQVTTDDSDLLGSGARQASLQEDLLPMAQLPGDVAIQYGSLVACIDFGDQLGSLLAGPVVAILGISRENDWSNLDFFILICAACKVFPLAFLWLLKS